MTQAQLPFPPDDAPEPAESDPSADTREPADTDLPTDGSPAAPPRPARELPDPLPPLEDVDVDRVVGAPACLVPFVDAGVLGPADVHVATCLTRLGGDQRDEVLLAAALAVRAPRRRHVCVDLTTVRHGVVADLTELAERERHDDGATEDPRGGGDPIDTLPWPEPDGWRRALENSPLVEVRDPTDLAEPDDAGRDVRPLTLAGPRLYLDRYWRYERRVATALDHRARSAVDALQTGACGAALDAAFDGAAPDRQRVAAALAASQRLTIVAGGPGTGKTTTVARLLRVLAAEASAAGRPAPHVALAAPTGKAAARLTESIREALASRPGDRDRDEPDELDDGQITTGAAAEDDLLRGLTASTVHRLLGPRGSSSRFRHHRGVPLPHDVVIVDETSMVPLALLAKLLDAVRLDARIVLLGDPHQLASVEAGSVLADLVGDPESLPSRSRQVRATLSQLAGEPHLADTATADAPGVHDVLVVLDRVHRFRAGSGLDRFATAVRRGEAEEAIAELTAADDLTWIDPGGPAGDAAFAEIRDRIVTTGREVLTAAREGDGVTALTALDATRVLCAHRRGGAGVAGWVARAEAWIRTDAGLRTEDRWYVGRPVLVTTNDRRLGLWNGDLGVVVRDPGTGGVRVAFPGTDGHGARYLPPARVGEVETVHAMTVHKSQGSQVGHAVVVLPDPASRICTRELLYTAVTRARSGATIVATEAALRATIAARTQRASGLGAALRPAGLTPSPAGGTPA